MKGEAAKKQDTFYKLSVFCHFYSHFYNSGINCDFILFFHAERQILICYRATELMTQDSVHHDYKYSALKQTAHVPFHVLE